MFLTIFRVVLCLSSTLDIRLQYDIAPIVATSLNLHQMSRLAILNHLHRSIASLDQLTQLEILCILRTVQQLIGIYELSMAIVGDDHLWGSRLNGWLLNGSNFGGCIVEGLLDLI